MLKNFFRKIREKKLPLNAVWKNKDNDMPVKIVALMGEMNGVFYWQTEGGTGLPEHELQFKL